MFRSAVTRFNMDSTLANIIQEELLRLKLRRMIIPLLLNEDL